MHAAAACAQPGPLDTLTPPRHICWDLAAAASAPRLLAHAPPASPFMPTAPHACCAAPQARLTEVEVRVKQLEEEMAELRQEAAQIKERRAWAQQHQQQLVQKIKVGPAQCSRAGRGGGVHACYVLVVLYGWAPRAALLAAPDQRAWDCSTLGAGIGSPQLAASSNPPRLSCSGSLPWPTAERRHRLCCRGGGAAGGAARGGPPAVVPAGRCGQCGPC